MSLAGQFGYSLLTVNSKEITVKKNEILTSKQKFTTTKHVIAFLAHQLGVPQDDNVIDSINSCLFMTDMATMAVKYGCVENITIHGCVRFRLDELDRTLFNFMQNYGISTKNVTHLNGFSHVLIDCSNGGLVMSASHEKIRVLGNRDPLYLEIGDWAPRIEGFLEVCITKNTADKESNANLNIEKIRALLKTSQRHMAIGGDFEKMLDDLKSKNCGYISKKGLLTTLGSVRIKTKKRHSIGSKDAEIDALCSLYNKISGCK